MYHLRLFTQWRRKLEDSLWVKWVFHFFLAQKKKKPKNNIHMPKHKVYTLWGGLLGYQALGWQNPMHRLACHAINVGTAWLLLKSILSNTRIFLITHFCMSGFEVMEKKETAAVVVVVLFGWFFGFFFNLRMYFYLSSGAISSRVLCEVLHNEMIIRWHFPLLRLQGIKDFTNETD